jgi:hypothetical protein
LRADRRMRVVTLNDVLLALIVLVLVWAKLNGWG